MSGLHPDARKIAEAVLEAVAIPYAATEGDDEARQPILQSRVIALTVHLRGLLADDPADPDAELSHLRTALAAHPAEGYKTWDEAVAERHAAEQAGPEATP